MRSKFVMANRVLNRHNSIVPVLLLLFGATVCHGFAQRDVNGIIHLESEKQIGTSSCDFTQYNYDVTSKTTHYARLLWKIFNGVKCEVVSQETIRYHSLTKRSARRPAVSDRDGKKRKHERRRRILRRRYRLFQQKLSKEKEKKEARNSLRGKEIILNEPLERNDLPGRKTNKLIGVVKDASLAHSSLYDMQSKQKSHSHKSEILKGGSKSTMASEISQKEIRLNGKQKSKKQTTNKNPTPIPGRKMSQHTHRRISKEEYNEDEKQFKSHKTKQTRQQKKRSRENGFVTSHKYNKAERLKALRKLRQRQKRRYSKHRLPNIAIGTTIAPPYTLSIIKDVGYRPGSEPIIKIVPQIPLQFSVKRSSTKHSTTEPVKKLSSERPTTSPLTTPTTDRDYPTTFPSNEKTQRWPLHLVLADKGKMIPSEAISVEKNYLSPLESSSEVSSNNIPSTFPTTSVSNDGRIHKVTDITKKNKSKTKGKGSGRNRKRKRNRRRNRRRRKRKRGRKSKWNRKYSTSMEIAVSSSPSISAKPNIRYSTSTDYINTEMTSTQESYVSTTLLDKKGTTPVAIKSTRPEKMMHSNLHNNNSTDISTDKSTSYRDATPGNVSTHEPGRTETIQMAPHVPNSSMPKPYSTTELKKIELKPSSQPDESYSLHTLVQNSTMAINGNINSNGTMAINGNINSNETMAINGNINSNGTMNVTANITLIAKSPKTATSPQPQRPLQLGLSQAEGISQTTPKTSANASSEANTHPESSTLSTLYEFITSTFSPTFKYTTITVTDTTTTTKTTTSLPSSTTKFPYSKWRNWARRMRKRKKHGKRKHRGKYSTGIPHSFKISSSKRGSVAGSLIVADSSPDKSVVVTLKLTTKSPFVGYKTAYDFLSGQRKIHGNRRSETHRESFELNRVMSEKMCKVFNKRFVPTHIGGKCV